MHNLKLKVWVLTSKGNQFEVTLPAKRIVCETCHGTGKHVNRAIDGHGLSSDDFAEDPDFAEAYFRGDYDIRCEECDGKNVVLIVDEEALSPKMRTRLYNQYYQEDRAREERESERRMRC